MAFAPPMRAMALGAFMALFALAGAPGAQAAELILFESDDCYWCEQWERDIGGDYNGTLAGQAAPVRRIDAHKDPLGAQYGVSQTPTFVVLDDSGAEQGRILGYPGKARFWSLLNKHLNAMR